MDFQIFFPTMMMVKLMIKYIIDIQELIKGGNAGNQILNNEDLYAKLSNIVRDKEGKQYIE